MFYGVLGGEISLVKNKVLEEITAEFQQSLEPKTKVKKRESEYVKPTDKPSDWFKQNKKEIIKSIPPELISMLDKIEIFRVKEGVCFGEMAIIKKISRNATAIAVGDVDLFSLNTESFNLSFTVIYLNHIII